MALWRHRLGFTLIELLLVLAILGAIVAVVVPTMGPGLVGTQLTVSSRSLLQASRYARTMAILHQANTEVVLTSAKDEDGKGVIEVRAASSAMPFADDIETPVEETSFNGDNFDLSSDEADNLSTNSPTLPSTNEIFSEAVSSKFECKGISFIFEGYDDVVDGEEAVDTPAANDEESEEYPQIVLQFNSNGTCRPFTIRVCSGEDLSYLVKVNAIGVGKIEEYGDDEE